MKDDEVELLEDEIISLKEKIKELTNIIEVMKDNKENLLFNRMKHEYKRYTYGRILGPASEEDESASVRRLTRQTAGGQTVVLTVGSTAHASNAIDTQAFRWGDDDNS